MRRRQLVELIHASPPKAVVAVTGGGMSLVGDLLTVPGASRTVLEVVVPYAEPALEAWVGGPVEGAVSASTALRMARSAADRAARLAPGAAGETALLGLGVTAALASDRPKRGEHRAHLALARAAAPGGAPAASPSLSVPPTVWTITLAKGARQREEEDRVVADLALLLLARGCGVRAELDCGLGDGDVLVPEDARP